MLVAKDLMITRRDKQICAGLDLTISPGDFWGVLGVNGRGKTTLLHTLCGLIKPKQGSLFLAEESLVDIPRRKLAAKVGLLLQDEKLTFPVTVYESIQTGQYAMSCHRPNISEILELLKLKHYMNHDVLQLSGGEQRRVSIGRILYQSPKVFLLDEPLNHLDPYFRQLILKRFKKLCDEEEASIMMTGHDLSLMSQFCNRFLLLCQDERVVVGDKNEVFNKENLEAVYGVWGEA